MRRAFLAFMLSAAAMTGVMADVPLDQCSQIEKSKESSLSPFDGIILLKSGVLKNIRLQGLYASKKESIKEGFPPHKAFVNDKRPELLQYNVPLDPIAALAQYLFPSVDGAILTHNERKNDLFGFIAKAKKDGNKYGISLINDLFKELRKEYGALTPESLGEKEFDDKKLERIVGDWIVSVRKEAKGEDNIKANVAKEALQVLTAALKTSFSPSSEKNKKEDVYPPHTALHLLVAFAFRMADSAEEFSQLDEVVTLDKKASSFSLEAYGKGLKGFKDKFASKDSGDSGSFSPKEVFLFSQGYEVYKATVPELVGYQTTIYQQPAKGEQERASIEYPDCGETSLLNFFRIVLGKDGAFSPEYVKGLEEKLNLPDDKKTQAHQVFLQFFKDRPRFAQAFTTEGHGAWSQVVSNLNEGSKGNKIFYGNSIKDKNEPICNIKGYAGIINMLSVIEKLIPHETLTKPWEADPELLAKAKGGMNGLSEDEKKQVELTLKQAADKLTELCKLFSREDFHLDWSCKEEKILPSITGVDVAFTINGNATFTWQFMSGHFEVRDNSVKGGDWRAAITFDDPHLGDNIFLQSLFVKASDSTHPDFQPAHLWGALRMINVRAKGVILCRLLEKAHDRPDFLHWATVVLEKNFPVGDGHASGVLWPLWDCYKDLIGRNSDLKEAFDKRLKPKAKPTSQKMLVTSVDLGYTNVVKHILSQPNLAVDFKSQVFDGDTLLHLACKRKNQDVVHILIRAKAGLDGLNSGGDAPLHIAINNNNNELIKLLLEHEADVNLKNEGGDSPLHMAIEKKDDKLINLFFEHKADVNLKNKNGDSPLHMAIGKNDEALIKLLLEHQADRKLPDRFGQLPIHLAVKVGNEDLVRQLVEEDESQASLLSGRKVTPLHIAAQVGNETICRFLIDRSAHVNAQDHMERTPLHYAAMNKNPQVLKLLLEKKADINLKDKEGFSALHHAVKDNNEEAVTVLVKGGGDVNIQAVKGLQPFHLAVKNKNTNIAKMLLDKGGDTDKYFREGSYQNNALALALDNDDEEMVKLIIDYKPQIHSVSCRDRSVGQYPDCKDAITYSREKGVKKEILDLLEEYQKTLPEPEDNTEYDDDGNPIF